MPSRRVRNDLAGHTGLSRARRQASSRHRTVSKAELTSRRGALDLCAIERVRHRRKSQARQVLEFLKWGIAMLSGYRSYKYLTRLNQFHFRSASTLALQSLRSHELASRDEFAGQKNVSGRDIARAVKVRFGTDNLRPRLEPTV